MVPPPSSEIVDEPPYRGHTPDLSDSMRRRLEKEQEALASPKPEAIAIAGPSAGDADDRLHEKLAGIPTPPPEYPDITEEMAANDDKAHGGNAIVISNWNPECIGGQQYRQLRMPAGGVGVMRADQRVTFRVPKHCKRKAEELVYHPYHGATSNGFLRHNPKNRLTSPSASSQVRPALPGEEGFHRHHRKTRHHHSSFGRRVVPNDRDPHFEGTVGLFRLVAEWLTSLVFDTVLLVAELAFNFWLALLLKDQDRRPQYQAILCLFFVPSFANALAWVKLSRHYPKVGFFFMMAVTFFGFPSPLFVYIWHLYLSAFCHQAESQRSKILANTLRMMQACCSSLPLLMLNTYTLLNLMKVEGREKDALNISQLTRHLGEVNVHGLAALTSLLNILRAACLFNERKTFTLLFVMVGYPFLLFTILSRIAALTVITCFMDVWWTIILVLGLVLTNLALYYVCRKTSTYPSSLPSSPPPSALSNSLGLEQIRGDIEEHVELRSKIVHATESSEVGSSDSSNEDVNCCNATQKRRAEQEGDSESCGGGEAVLNVHLVPRRPFYRQLPKLVLLSLCSAVVPAGYTNDYRSHHPRIKGGLFILLNYIFDGLWIGLALGFTIVNDVPNTFHGVSLPQPSLKLEVPGSKVIVQAGGFDVALNLPNTRLDLGSMPSVSATLNTDSTDVQHAIIIPLVLAMIAFPFVVMRAAMMELDCFVARKKVLEEGHYHGSTTDETDGLIGRDRSISLHDTVRANSENKELKSRLYLTVCCSMLGMCVFTVLMIVTGALLMLNLR